MHMLNAKDTFSLHKGVYTMFQQKKKKKRGVYNVVRSTFCLFLHLLNGVGLYFLSVGLNFLCASHCNRYMDQYVRLGQLVHAVTLFGPCTLRGGIKKFWKTADTQNYLIKQLNTQFKGSTSFKIIKVTNQRHTDIKFGK